ncbi:MAG: tyrosine-type recombinase/integrase [Anaerolineales bacterium]|nr:tyrosine-type recombinase/integrase [Anaerolineales bacterium]
MSQHPLPAHAEKFLTTIDVAPKTVITYRHALRTFAEFLLDSRPKPSIDDNTVPLQLLQEDSPARFRHWMRSEREFSRRTENTYLAGVIRFIEWLDVHSLLPSGLMATRMKLILREARGRRRTGYKTQPIKEAVPQIIAYYDSSPLPAPETPRLRRRRLTLLRNRALVHTLFASGMRAHELAGLRRSDCADGHADRILITGKGEKERVVLLNPEAQAAIRAYLKARDEDRAANRKRPVPGKQEPLFIRHDRDQITPISTKTVWLVVSQAARALGLDTSISPHDFRRYIATAMLSEGMPLESVQEFLGHESIVTTRTVYARTRNEVLEDQVKTYRPTPAQALRRSLRYQKER